jgi:hypothetical protein
MKRIILFCLVAIIINSYCRNIKTNNSENQGHIDCINNLPILRDQLLKSDSKNQLIAFETLQNMHFKECGKLFLFDALKSRDLNVSQSAFEIIMYFSVECWHQANDKNRPLIFSDYKPYLVIPVIEEISTKVIDSKYKKYLELGLSDLIRYSDCLKEVERYQTYKATLSKPIRADVKQKVDEILSKPKDQFTILSIITFFDGTLKENPSLTEEQIFEVASILGNKTNTNAMYYMLYSKGLPKQGGILEDPCFDFKDIRINIQDGK